MKKVDYQHFGRFVYPINLSRFDKKLYFCLVKTDFSENKYVSDLYTLRGKKPFKLTSSGDVKSYYKAGGGIVFPSLRSQKDRDAVKNGKELTVLQKLSATGEAEEWLRIEKNVNEFCFINEKSFFFTAGYSFEKQARLKAAKGNEKKAQEQAKEEEDYIVLEGVPFWTNGGSFQNKETSPLYLHKNGRITPVTDEMTSVMGMFLSADKKTLYYIAAPYAPYMDFENKLFELDVETLESKDISLGKNVFHGSVIPLEGGGALLFATTKEKYGLNENAKVYVRRSSEEPFTLLYGGGIHCFANSVGSDVKMGRTLPEAPVVASGKYYTLDTLGDSSHIVGLDIESGEITQATMERGMVTEFVSDGEGGFYAFCMRGGGVELYRVNAEGERQLTNLNTECVTKYEYSEPIDVSFVNEKGTKISGFVIKPAGFEEGKKYPAILDIHGGPKTAYGKVYFHEMQLWSSMGYAVMFCNPTGSDGRGDEFSDIRGGYGQTDFNDLMRFVDTVCENFEFVNRYKIAVTGGSYGGFMTNWIIGHTDRFVAAASQRSISNFVSFSNMSDIGAPFGRDQMAAGVWDDVERVWAQSPLKYADKVKTPTLFLHSDADYRCPLAEGLQMFYALCYHGVESRMCIFKGENHELSRSGKPKHRIRRLKEITEWLAKYLN